VTDSNGCRGKDSMLVYQESINEIIPGVSVKLYPNPTNNNAYVKFSKAVELKGYELFDGLGRKVFDRKIQGITSEFKVDVSSLPKGSYYLRLIFDENQNIAYFCAIDEDKRYTIIIHLDLSSKFLSYFS